MQADPETILQKFDSSKAVAAPAEKLRVLSLFAGIGGFDLGLERTGGFSTVAFCEINEFCQRVLAKHWPHVPCFPDITKLKGQDVGTVDVICGGFPCQDISTAGPRAGIEGERSGLWKEFARLIGELRPSFAIVENVTALLGFGMGRVLGDLAALGYDAEWHCIPASAVGAPITRDRLWIVAVSTSGVTRDGRPTSDLLGLQREFLQACRCADDSALEPGIDPISDGVPSRFHRISALGNAVVPQIPELIGRAILQARRAA
jgi:DNA (cytosine-5)-methyltransferase 1